MQTTLVQLDLHFYNELSKKYVTKITRSAYCHVLLVLKQLTTGVKVHCSLIVCAQVELQLASVPEAWMAFLQTLTDADQMLKKHKDKFKAGLIHSSEDFKKQVGNMVEEFLVKGM